jgi:hypothetical protein
MKFINENTNTEYVNDWLSVVQEKVETLNFGVVQIVVHNSKVVQVERTEKIRFDGRQSNIKGKVEVKP